LALPPGLAFGAASERFLERAEKREDAGYYLSVRRLVTTARENLPWWTPALPLYHALVCQVDLIARSGGWPARWERHARMREAMDRWVAARSDVRLLANGGRSPALSALVIPDTHEVARMVEALEAMGYQVGTALTPKHGPIIRIGHMGDLTPEHLAALLGDISGLLAAPGPVRPRTVLA
jgi:aspartate aminotransferase-like enzyme